MPAPPELLAALQGTGYLGLYYSDRELVCTLLVELLLAPRKSKRVLLMRRIGEIGQRYILDNLDACSEEDAQDLARDVWMAIIRRVSVAAAHRQFSPSLEDPIAFIYQGLSIQRCLFDDKLHFGIGIGADFCPTCQNIISEVGLSIQEVREKIKSGQRIR